MNLTCWNMAKISANAGVIYFFKSLKTGTTYQTLMDVIVVTYYVSENVNVCIVKLSND